MKQRQDDITSWCLMSWLKPNKLFWLLPHWIWVYFAVEHSQAVMIRRGKLCPFVLAWGWCYCTRYFRFNNGVFHLPSSSSWIHCFRCCNCGKQDTEPTHRNNIIRVIFYLDSMGGLQMVSPFPGDWMVLLWTPLLCVPPFTNTGLLLWPRAPPESCPSAIGVFCNS